jgi:uncharacterized protein with PIN domain
MASHLLSIVGVGVGEQRGCRFVVDAMLKNIVSWLRILGYDTIYWGGGDREALGMAEAEDRVILTMDRGLAATAARRGLRVLLFQENDIPGILARIARELGLNLSFDPRYTRCPVCNHPLNLGHGSGREEWTCPGCGKKYWRGSHWRNISRTLEEARKRLSSSSG